jgi:sialidase-1
MRYMMRARKEAMKAMESMPRKVAVPSSPSSSPPPPPSIKYTNVFYPNLANIACYRIPSIIQTTNGVLLAFAEARKGSCSDGAAYSIAQRRSLDGGITWSNVTFPVGSSEYMVGNPSSVALANGSSALLYVRHSPTCVGVCGIGNGIVFSNDDGISWSLPINQNFGIAKGALPGPGTALQLKSGRILVVSHKGAYKNDYVSISDDGGKTFVTNKRPFPLMDEAALTQLTNGSVMLNMRHQTSPSLGRGVAVSNDGGLTFGPISYDKKLISPVCQASIVTFGGATYFSNPADAHARDKITIRKSIDNAETWGESLLIHEGPTFGYSCLVKGELQVGEHDQGGILYESSNKTISFSRFNLDMSRYDNGGDGGDGGDGVIRNSTSPCKGFDEFSRLLLKLPEHTWGSCGSAHMHVAKPESGSWKSKNLIKAILKNANPFFKVVQESWD